VTPPGRSWGSPRQAPPGSSCAERDYPLAALPGARYSYAGGNPITGADPTGLFDWGVVWAGVAVGAAILGTAACVIAEPCGLAEIAVVGGLAVGEGTAIVLVGGSAAVGPAILGEQLAESPLTRCKTRRAEGVRMADTAKATCLLEASPIVPQSGITGVAEDSSETTDPMGAPSETTISGMTMAREIRTLTIGTGAVRAPFAGLVGR